MNLFLILEDKNENNLKVEGLWTMVANGFKEPDNNSHLTAKEMKYLEANYLQDAKALRKIQIGVPRVYFSNIGIGETTKEA